MSSRLKAPPAPVINRTVLMSGADYFSDEFAINAFMDAHQPVDVAKAVAEHAAIKTAMEAAGIKVVSVKPPESCQDGVYTANWGLSRGDTVVLANLPNKRKAEEPYAEQAIAALGKKVVKAPYRFSGQGDSLPCGNRVFMGTGYRNDPQMHQFVADTLGYEVVSLQAVPVLDAQGQPVINPVSGWPDSYFYDIDLAISVLRPDLIAWCPEAFTPESQERMRQVPIEKIEVNLEEAKNGFACNLISTGHTVIMGTEAPQLKAAIEAHGLTVVTPEVAELKKGGGFIRCISLTLDNE